MLAFFARSEASFGKYFFCEFEKNDFFSMNRKQFAVQLKKIVFFQTRFFHSKKKMKKSMKRKQSGPSALLHVILFETVRIKHKSVLHDSSTLALEI